MLSWLHLLEYISSTWKDSEDVDYAAGVVWHSCVDVLFLVFKKKKKKGPAIFQADMGWAVLRSV